MKNKHRLIWVLLILILSGCNTNTDSTCNKEVLLSTGQEKFVEKRKNANNNGFFVYDKQKKVLQQWIWGKGEIVAEYENLDIEKLLLVTDKYVYYYQTEKETEKKRASIYCIPIQVFDGNDILKVKEIRKIFAVELTLEDEIYSLSIVDNRIVCITNSSRVFLYDEEEKKIEEVQEDLGALDFAAHTITPSFKGAIYFTDDKQSGLYELNLNEPTKRLEQINVSYVNSFVCNKDTAFYSIESVEKKTPMIYSLGKNSIFLKYTEIEKILSSYNKVKTGKRIYKCINRDITLYTIFENRLYFSVEFGYAPYGVDLRKKVMLSVGINNSKDVRVEEKINIFLEKIYECSDGVESKGYIIETVSGKCLAMGAKGEKFENSVAVPYIYNLKDDKVKRLSKKDGEWWYCYYNYSMG